ncbi:hypothetical protein LCGC14_0840170 [marine sediment metagenome]|uniref:Uncharacterized protein n=1 Tax=marine sediment metagenome TaxID=412755 RepID=A0A0F9PI52_9ZZZZ
MILYHITREGFLPRIRKVGLEPPVFLTGKRDLDAWRDSAAIELFEQGSRGRLILLKVDIPRDWISERNEHPVGGRTLTEYIVDRGIPPSRIKMTGLHFTIGQIKGSVIEARKGKKIISRPVARTGQPAFFARR